MSELKFQRGDVVTNKAGGPEMIVISIFTETSEYRCRFWVPLQNCFKNDKFHEFELNRKVESERGE